MIEINDLLIVAYDGKLTLLTSDGEIVETLSGEVGVPSGMQSLGYDEQGFVLIKAAHGYYQVNIDELEWKEFDYLEGSWSKETNIPEHLKNNLYSKYRGSGLPLERVLLDFHSGRILGNWGVYLFDFIALLFVSLAISGIWMWTKLK